MGNDISIQIEKLFRKRQDCRDQLYAAIAIGARVENSLHCAMLQAEKAVPKGDLSALVLILRQVERYRGETLEDVKEEEIQRAFEVVCKDDLIDFYKECRLIILECIAEVIHAKE